MQDTNVTEKVVDSTEESAVKRASLKQRSTKSYAIAVSLSAIFGVLGVHHFYLGRYLEGIIDFGLVILAIYFYATGQFGWAILVFAVDSLHTFIVTIMLLTGSFKDGKGNVVCYPGQKLKSE